MSQRDFSEVCFPVTLQFGWLIALLIFIKYGRQQRNKIRIKLISRSIIIIIYWFAVYGFASDAPYAHPTFF